MNKILIYLTLSFFVHTLIAQSVPFSFHYQGQFLDDGGLPIANQNIGIQVTLVSEEITALPDFVETHSATTDNQGRFNIIVGSGTESFGGIEEVNWMSGLVWLKVNADATGGTDYEPYGVTQLLAVPFAIKAAYVENSECIPGATGPMGPMGPTGPTGTMGPAGPTGPQGLAGVNGINGITGATGPQGIQGIQGPAGPSGPAGEYNFEPGPISPNDIYTLHNVGIQLNMPACELDVAGNICANGLLINSDKKYKKNIKPISLAHHPLEKIKGHTYFLDKAKYEEQNFSDDLQYGFIAQEIEAVIPELVYTKPNGLKAVNYTQLIPLLWAYLSEQETAIKALEAEIKALKNNKQ